jgi:hypothetical protein
MNTCQNCGTPNLLEDHYCALCRFPVVKDNSGAHDPQPIMVQPVNIPVAFEDELVTGSTQVRVMKTIQGVPTKIHEGVVIQQTSKFARVYNPMSPDAGGDLSPEMSQMFPVQSDNCWLEIIGSQTKPMPTPPCFR